MSIAADHVVVVAGEALIDIVAGADGRLAAHPGGGPYNVARATARLQQPTAYLGRLSTDGFGTLLRRELAADGVRLEAVVGTEDPTTLAVAELDGRGAAQYHFYFEGTSAPGLTLGAATAALPADPAALYVGTLGLVLEPMASTLESLVAGAGPEALVAVDPNCRPSAIRDPEAYRRRLDRILERADVVKVSEDDLAWLFGGEEPVAAARRLLTGGGVALVTLGGDGAVVVTAGDAVAVAAPQVDVVDTIGAGDAFVGAFLARWLSHGLGRRDLGRLDDLVEGTRYACAAAALTCGRAGADPPRLAEM